MGIFTLAQVAICRDLDRKGFREILEEKISPPAKEAAKHSKAEPTERQLAGRGSYVIDFMVSYSFVEQHGVPSGAVKKSIPHPIMRMVRLREFRETSPSFAFFTVRSSNPDITALQSSAGTGPGQKLQIDENINRCDSIQ